METLKNKLHSLISEATTEIANLIARNPFREISLGNHTYTLDFLGKLCIVVDGLYYDIYTDIEGVIEDADIARNKNSKTL